LLLHRADDRDHCERGRDRAKRSGREPACTPAIAVGGRASKLGEREYARAKIVRRAVANALSAKQGPNRLQPFELFPAALAARDVRLGERRVRRVELAVDKSAEQQFLISAGGGHWTLLDCALSVFAGGSNSFASIPRARESRDMTVPMGTPVTVAISA